MPNGMKPPGAAPIALGQWGAMPWWQKMFYGKPTPSYAAPGYTPTGGYPEGYGPTGVPTPTTPKADQAAADKAMAGLGGVAPFPTEPPPAGYAWKYDFVANAWVPDWIGIKEPGAGQPTYTTTGGEYETDAYGRKAYYNERTDSYDYPPDWNVDPATQQAGYISPQQQWERGEAERYAQTQQQQFAQTMQWQMAQQQAQLEAQRQERLATLRASPASWLEYASLSGEQPAIQPWMMPLMPQQYQGLQAGGAIPGYQAGGERMNLPQLTTPSRQYQARTGPTAMAQYGGYEQARTGETPENLQWRLWSQAPPGGMSPGLRWQR